MKKSPSIAKWLIPLVTGLVFTALWEAAVRWFALAEFILPAPSQIALALAEALPAMTSHIVSTLTVALSGLALAVSLSILVAFLLESSRSLKTALYPYLVLSQTVPIIFVYTLLIIWFGYGYAPKIIIVVLVCFFPVTVNLSDGLSQTDGELVDLFRSMRASPLRILLNIKFPGALPAFFSGAKIAAAYSVIGAVLVEWMGAKPGMGYYIKTVYESFLTKKVFASLVVIVILSLAVFGLVVILERITVAWKYKRSL